jgi:hypothetical protein
MIDRLIEDGRHYGMEKNVEKTRIMRISTKPSAVHIAVGKNSRIMWNISITWLA